MKTLLSSREMKQADRKTIEHFGIPSMVLMERAALGVVSFLESFDDAYGRIGVVCGCGNNGGDGFAIARLLFLKGYDVILFFAGEEEKCTEDCLKQKRICENYQISYATDSNQLCDCDMIMDAIFGIGLSREILGTYFEMITFLNTIDARKIAIDMPSGISADDGNVLGVGFEADYTITFGFEKIGQKLYPGKRYCGQTVTVDIGISSHSLTENRAVLHCMTKDDLTDLPKAQVDANKGSVGKVLLIAGSDVMAGAACLAAYSALSTGCGLLKVYTSEKNRDILLTKIPEAIVVCYDKYDEKELLDLMQWADAIAIGPGLGQSKTAEQLVLQTTKNASVPLVIDADALNIISRYPGFLKQPHTEVIVTPHIGEMARLTNNPNLYVVDHKLALCQDYANDNQVICVLKDAATLIAVPYEGGYINESGTEGMATAGSGDVLTGVLVSLIAQGMAPSKAAPIGVYLHGLAGEIAAEQKSVHGMLASDIVEGIRIVFKERGL